jgi:small subunit ribosomal protein S20
MVKLKFGRHTSAKKAERQTLTHTQRNKGLKDKIKSVTRLLKKNVDKKDGDAANKVLTELYSLLDKAKKKNILHANNAAHKKSQAAKLVNKLSAKA